MDVSTVASATLDFARIGRKLGLPNLEVDSILDTLANWSESWLLVLDNADELDQDYTRYFPSGVHHGVVLITSRDSECANQYGTLGHLSLDGLDEPDARNLLLKAATRPIGTTSQIQNDCDAVAKLLGYHPLSLIQAGIYVARGHCKMSEYPSHHKRQRKRVMTFRASKQLSRYRDTYATFEASAEKLEEAEDETAKDALQLLCILSHFDHTAVPFKIFELAWHSSKLALGRVDGGSLLSQWHTDQLPAMLQPFESIWEPFRLIEAARTLASLSFVEIVELSGSDAQELKMHPVTHCWAKDRQNSYSNEKSWILAGFILSLASLNDINDFVTLHIPAWLSEDVVKICPKASVTQVAQAMGVLGMRRYSTAWVRILGEQMEKLLKAYSIGPTEQWPDLTLFLQRYGVHLGEVGRIEEAAQHWQKLDQQLSGTQGYPNVSWVLKYNTAIRYHSQGRYAETIRILDNLRRQMSWPDTDPRMLQIRILLADAYICEGDKEVATVECHCLVQVVDQPSMQLTLLSSMDGQLVNGELGRLLIRLKMPDVAVSFLERVLNNPETQRLYPASDFISLKVTLAYAHLNSGQPEKSIDVLEHIQAHNHAHLQRYWTDRCAVEEELAYACWKIDERQREAIQLLRHSIQVRRTRQDPEHPIIVTLETILREWEQELADHTSQS